MKESNSLVNIQYFLLFLGRWHGIEVGFSCLYIYVSVFSVVSSVAFSWAWKASRHTYVVLFILNVVMFISIVAMNFKLMKVTRDDRNVLFFHSKIYYDKS